MNNYIYRANILKINDTDQNNEPMSYYCNYHNHLLCFELLKMTSLIYYLKNGITHNSITKLSYLSTIMLIDDHSMKPSILINHVKSDQEHKFLKKVAYLEIDRIYEEAAHIVNLVMFINIAIIANTRGLIPYLPPEIWFVISTSYGYIYKLPRRVPFSFENRTDFYLEYLLFNILYYRKKNIKRIKIPDKDRELIEYNYTDYIGETLLINNRYKNALSIYNRINRRLYENNMFYNNITDNLELLYTPSQISHNYYY